MKIFIIIFLFVKILSEKLCLDSYLNITENKTDISIACANFTQSEGWHLFDVETYENNLRNRSYYAGYLEGYIYYKYINYHYVNIMQSIYYNISLNNEIKNYISQQNQFIKSLLTEFKLSKFLFPGDLKMEDIYLKTLSTIVDQYEGMYSGYVKASMINNQTILTNDEFYILVMQSDLEDIYPAFTGISYRNRECSGIVKLTSDNLIVGHNTHNLYTLMNRIYKNYNLNLKIDNKRLNNYKFSSRPGDLNSKDDFYILDNRMVVLETSIEIFDFSIYKNLNPNTIPKWIRVNIANKLASNNQEWINIFFEYNSGTHNNQWLIIDFKEWEKNSDKNIVHIVEQIPLLNKKFYKDMTQQLKNTSYVATYNAPYFDEVIEKAGYSKFNQSDYFNSRRYYLFNELAQEANDIEGIKKLIRFHNKTDICDSIAPRCDLIQNRPFGSVDGKVTDYNLLKLNKSEIIYGPPYIKGISDPFNFTVYGNWSHLGIPDYINYTWIKA